MCDLRPIRNFLIAASTAILVAIGLIITAISTNSNFITSISTPGFLAGAAAAIGVALTLLTNLLIELDAFDNCVHAGVRTRVCRGQYYVFAFNIATAIATMTGLLAAVIATIAISWVPGAAIPTSVYVIYVLTSVNMLLTVVGASSWGAFESCMRKSSLGSRIQSLGGHSTPPPSSSEDTTKFSYKLASCDLNMAICDQKAMRSIFIGNGTISVSKTFAFLLKPKSSLAITSIKVEINQVSYPISIFQPNQHSILDASYYAVLFDWNVLSKKIKIEADKSSRTWKVAITINFSDQSSEKLVKTLLLSN